MNTGANRFRLIEAINSLRLLPVSVVGHSIGSTINVGFGATTPHRYAKRQSGKRRAGYFRRAERDLFLASASWELRKTNGYCLRWSDNPRRIAKEIELSVGKTVISVSLGGLRRQAQIRFASGETLRFWPHLDEDGGGWNLNIGKRHLSVAGRS
ncbi:MAG: hypothetical protein EOR30_12065 [Mesorhizobium sp.]|uniref:hypothetical protein n=1 Tax=unclassified Mesorhizobium TaxID=325217 RepID=UPI000FCAE0B1|nr:MULTISPECIES: hypothetical protein [unclassified Mesorhizobium]RUV68443.1 hypothetical protein EOA78_26620 [Mesorhizobium sp. M5C.F.Cr.IN.023.01.1.1]RWF87344.1 MAG: hypothetical protein EOQ36_12965 [Mesorhizobium sp.]RWF91690.1 MAG: hypothetical protein EOQ45_24515 [Mesorhizobium sp.]RWI33776.1 MAG: hypothetical protein EOR14_32335 [Mesorhizobium sp.]RWI44793.1 MAG: hypothetical protein EOR15_24450 [Mesorhizobium sp.]